MFKSISHLLLFLTIILSCCKQQKEVRIDREIKKWHKIVLNFEGPETSELSEDSPFVNYRLDITFSNN